ncbi:hypothetical protein IFM89_021527 [Coptis chinensis]|uniref:Zinc knuckle CX2CX4HX4C domain-containing protein n=1 Tax=Coptis chinensis TaxID=261450 RepID=A0A835IM27_9MAGN|nr:hypothetical protein IFM89_021527 [Coptis chinensis]
MMETLAPTNGMVEVPVIDQPQTSNIAGSIAATQPNRSWRELFGDSNVVIQQSISGWSDYLVEYFIEKRLPFHLVKANLSRQWKTKGSYEVTADDDLFYFKFSEGEDQTKILEAVVVDSKFPTSIPIKVRGGGGRDVIDVKVEYPWIPSRCSVCGIFGHLDSKCVSATLPKPSQPPKKSSKQKS